MNLLTDKTENQVSWESLIYNIKVNMINNSREKAERRRLVETLRNCHLVKYDESLAEYLANVGKLVVFKSGEVFVVQGSINNDMYFILKGEADVSIDGRHVAIRRQFDAVGGLTIVNPLKPESGTLTAITNIVALKVSESDLCGLAESYSHIRLAIAIIELARWKERAVFLDHPNENPVLFLRCSAKNVKMAEELQANLKFANLNVQIWTDSFFGTPGILLENFLMEVENIDYAVFLLESEGSGPSYENKLDTFRENTIFELGLFLTRLPREHTFLIKEQNAEINFPLNLLGVATITYNLQGSNDITLAMNNVSHDLRNNIERLVER